MRQMFLQEQVNNNKRIEKVFSKAGESIAETLVGMMIVVMAMTMLAGAIRSSAKTNEAAEKIIDNSQANEKEVDSKVYFEISGVKDANSECDIKAIAVSTNGDSSNGYCYYTVKQ